MTSLDSQTRDRSKEALFSSYIEGLTNEDADILLHDNIHFHAPECVYVNTKDSLPLRKALEIATDVIIIAHPDDAEIGAPAPIIKGYLGKSVPPVVIVVTDGASPPNKELTGDIKIDQYLTLDKAEIAAVRRDEQRTAANIGSYTALVQLTNQSSEVKDQTQRALIAADIANMLSLCPHLTTVWSHNFFDEHATHRATAKATLEAIRNLTIDKRPKKFFGVEVWGPITQFNSIGLLETFDVSKELALQKKLIDAHLSQVLASKDYTEASIARRLHLANMLESHEANKDATHISVALDQSFLIHSYKSLNEWKKTTLEALNKHYLKD